MVLRKYSLFVVMSFIILMILTSCNSNEDALTKNENIETIAISTENTINDTLSNTENDSISVDSRLQKTELKTTNKNITHPEIEKIIITYFDNVEEITEKQQSFEYIDKIKSCTDIPDVNLISEIGDIKIQYVNKDKPTKYAILYYGSDQGVYAKYVKNKNSNYALKIK